MSGKVKIFILLVILLSSSHSIAGTGIQSPFSLGAGAREIALGGSALGNVDATTACYWNPSALSSAEKLSFSILHLSLYNSDISYQYIGLAIPTLDFGTIGFGVFRLGVSDIEKRNSNNILLGKFEDNRMAFYTAYAKMISNYKIGLALTFEYHKIEEFNSTSSPGLNLSVGRTFNSGAIWLPEVTMTLNGRNLIQPSKKLEQESVSYPTLFDFSMSTRITPSAMSGHSLILSSTTSKIENENLEAVFGVEYSINDLISLRGSVKESKMSFGAGLQFRNIDFDYAVVNRDLGNLHMFSITAGFGSSVNKRRALRKTQQAARFDKLLVERLESQNQEMVTRLTNQGEDLVANGELYKAEMMFGRALFIAKNNNLDTTSLNNRVEKIRTELQLIKAESIFKVNLDSAQVQFEANDFLQARYFVVQALNAIPNNTNAKQLMSKIDVAIKQESSREQMIESKLSLADSLLTYGNVNEALSILKSLNALNNNDNRVNLSLSRAEFEYWRLSAIESISTGSDKNAIAALDSALIRFPNHPWCINQKKKINKKTSFKTDLAVKNTETKTEQLSRELIVEVNVYYKDGKNLFEEGELSKAIELWEKVERIAPNFESVRNYLIKAYKFIGVELYSQNRLQDAITTWEKALTLAPKNEELTSYITRTKSEIEKMKELSYEF